MSARVCRLCCDPLPANSGRDRAYCGPCGVAMRSRGNIPEPDEASNAMASHALLKALVRYGFKHDRDLGLGADRFFALARDVGVIPFGAAA